MKKSANNRSAPLGMKKRIVAVAAGALALVLALLIVFFLFVPAGLYKVLESPYSRYYADIPDTFSSGAAVLSGKANPDIVNILIFCTDKGTEAELQSTTTHQADVILLCSFNKVTGDISLLSLPRHIVTAIPQLDVLGDLAYYIEQPLCNVHAMGKDEESASLMTLSAVQSVLGGLPIHGTVTLELEAISAITNALGGVTVECYIDIAPIYGVEKGTLIYLDGQAAVEYVRARNLPGMDGTNEPRLLRQLGFVRSLYAQLKARLKQNPFFAVKLLSALDGFYRTDLSLRELIFLGSAFIRKGELTLHHTFGYEESESLFIPDYAALSEYLSERCY